VRVAGIDVDLEAVIVAVTDDEPRVLTLPGAADALPSGRLDPTVDRTLDKGLRRWVLEQTGIEVGYVEQLYTFGDRERDPEERSGGPRVLSIAYLALVREEQPSTEAAWRAWYDFFPWEDHRSGAEEPVAQLIDGGLDAWIEAAGDTADRDDRAERAAITFGRGGSRWDEVRALERYELLYQARLVPEAYTDHGRTPPAHSLVPGAPMDRDHRRVAATALERLRGKLGYRPVVFELLPETFTLSHLQRVVEALSGVRIHKQNFRRVVESAGLVETTGEVDTATGGRPAALFRFRREVLRERPRLGVRLPGR